MVGLLDDVNDKMTLDFKKEGDVIVLIGEQKNDIGSSEYLHKIKNVELSPAPVFDLDEEYAVQKFISSLIKEKIILSAHDISEGGLIVALFESGFSRRLGFDVAAETGDEVRLDALWLGEAQSRVVVSCANEKLQDLKHKAASSGIDITVLGTVTKSSVKINSENWGEIDQWKNLYDTAIEKILS
jgi:phosphoribosylformylglycinamidine synthase